MAQSFSRRNDELLRLVDAVAREKSIPREIVLDVLVDAITAIVKKKYGKAKIEVEIDNNGVIRLFRPVRIVEDDSELVFTQELQASEEDQLNEMDNVSLIPLSRAKLQFPQAEIGQILREELPPPEFTRTGLPIAKSVLILGIRTAELEKEREEFADKVGEIVSGVVERIEPQGIIVKLGSSEAIIYKEGMLAVDRNLKHGERIKACLEEIRDDGRIPQLVLSRTSTEFLQLLFEQEVKEIAQGDVIIKSMAREAGSRSKVAVYSTDSGLDAVGACIGIRGARIKNIRAELGEEKIDIIKWHHDIVECTVNALAPLRVLKIFIDEEKDTVEVVMPDEDQSGAIGRRGQNVRLLSRLIGKNLSILTETQESLRRQGELHEASNTVKLLMHALDIDEILAQLLVAEGYKSVTALTEEAVIDSLANIEGLDHGIAAEITARAHEYHLSLQNAVEKPEEESSQEEFFAETEDNKLSWDEWCQVVLGILSRANIRSMQDVADLSSDEILELLADQDQSLHIQQYIEELITRARSKTYFKAINTDE